MPPSNVQSYTLLEPFENNTSLPVQQSGLSTYLASTSKYLFMIIAVISAFYLIYGGIQYLTTDMSSLKQDGKETIKRVIVGLIFIFSIWTVFNAINPDLLKVVDFGTGVVTGGPGISQGGGGATPAPAPANQGAVPGCSAGLVNVPGTCSSRPGGQCQLCGSMATNLNNLIADAAKAGINLSIISAYRDVSSCSVSNGGTCAAAGRSNHETGQAVDFNISKTNPNDPAYIWLKNNAAKYGFYNKLVPQASDEYNHWSVNGY